MTVALGGKAAGIELGAGKRFVLPTDAGQRQVQALHAACNKAWLWMAVYTPRLPNNAHVILSGGLSGGDGRNEGSPGSGESFKKHFHGRGRSFTSFRMTVAFLSEATGIEIGAGKRFVLPADAEADTDTPFTRRGTKRGYG